MPAIQSRNSDRAVPWRAAVTFATALGIAVTALAARPAGATASAQASAGPRPVSAAAVRSSPGQRQMTLAQAPAGLRAAVLKLTGQHAGRARTPVPAAAQQAELSADNGDGFGYSVAISGATAVVGAWSSSSFTGAAYVFMLSGTTWSRQAELVAPNGAQGDQFGYSVAVSGNTAVVGANGKTNGAGAAYVFTRSGTTWSAPTQLADPPGIWSDQFGQSVAVSGSTVLVGADGTNTSTGAAYVYVGSGANWVQKKVLTAAQGTHGSQFGISVALAGTTAVIGADGTNSDKGAAYVFTGSGASWVQQAALTAPDGRASDSFGTSVATSGTTAVVGAPGHAFSTGASYVFVQSGRAWVFQAELVASNGATRDGFGSSVATSGSAVLVGAPLHASGGAVYEFVRSGTAWRQLGQLSAGDTASGDSLGWSVALSGAAAAIGAPGKNLESGAAYMFRAAGSSWVEDAELQATAAGDQFGDSVAISGSTAVVGAPGVNSGTGAAYVFVNTFGSWIAQATLTAHGGAPGDSFGQSVAISGSTMVVGAPYADSGVGAAYVFLEYQDVWTQWFKLTQAGNAGDKFGWSVGVDGSLAAVGAPGVSSNTGAAYLFTGPYFSYEATLSAPGGVSGYNFGYSTAVSGSTVMIGAPDPAGKGAAYLFSGTGGPPSVTLTASDGANGDSFGQSVALSGATAVVGAYLKNSNAGAAYVFTDSAGSWNQTEVSPPAGTQSYGFGISVGVSGSIVLVGAYGVNGFTGAAFTFAPSGSGWAEQAELTASDAAAGDFFGFAVSVSGTTMIIGAFGRNSRAGAAYVFS